MGKSPGKEVYMSTQFCSKCGSAIPEGSAFCPSCGEAVAPAAQPQYGQSQYEQTQYLQPDLQQPQYQQPQYQQPVYQQPVYQQPVYQQTATVGAQPNLLVFGILSIVLYYIVGIILGAIGRRKGNAYMDQGGQLTGASKVGFILCKVGMILSIVLTVFFTILFIAGNLNKGGSFINNYLS